jgi:hypothetical protein
MFLLSLCLLVLAPPDPGPPHPGPNGGTVWTVVEVDRDNRPVARFGVSQPATADAKDAARSAAWRTDEVTGASLARWGSIHRFRVRGRDGWLWLPVVGVRTPHPDVPDSCDWTYRIMSEAA